MGSSEALLGDLRTIHTALEEVLGCSRPEVPSWRFPGRLSASLSQDDLLAISPGQEERVVALEGIVDRLLLLLQASLSLWSDGRHALPLSLSSTVKKYCRNLLQTGHKTHSLQKKVKQHIHQQSSLAHTHISEQLAAKEEQIYLLSSSLSESREQCQLLQTALKHPVPHSRPGSTLTRYTHQPCHHPVFHYTLSLVRCHMRPGEPSSSVACLPHKATGNCHPLTGSHCRQSHRLST